MNFSINEVHVAIKAQSCQKGVENKIKELQCLSKISVKGSQDCSLAEPGGP